MQTKQITVAQHRSLVEAQSGPDESAIDQVPLRSLHQS